MKARAMMKIHVPAYCPSLSGIQLSEKRGVRKDVKKVMAMSDMGIMDMSLLSLMPVDDVMAPVAVVVASMGMSIVMP